MKTEVVQTGAQLVGSALEAEMMVGSWFVPDEVDVATAGFTLAGKPLKQLYKVGKTLKASAEVAARINRVRDKLAGAVPAIRRKLGHSNFAIVMKRKKYRVSREGHIGPHGQREPAKMGELKEEEDILCNIPGGTCFVKGTLVSTQDGLRAIETLRAKDLVWSRDAATGTTQLKPIVQTFEKYATTLALTFSNGETVETTREHPFYVESQGFVKAGELGIGTSIVTRAGPSVQLVSVSSGAAQTVYNFEVADYHTYFVGLGEVWVHNTCVDTYHGDYGSFGIFGTLDEDGIVEFVIEAGAESPVRGTKMFEDMMAHFGGKVTAVRGSWSYGDNLAELNRLTANGMSLEEASKLTWTGRRCGDKGFTNVVSENVVGSPGNYTKVLVKFTK